MTVSTSTRTSSPFAASERCLKATVKAVAPATVKASTVDASEVKPDSELRLGFDIEFDVTEALPEIDGGPELSLGAFLHVWCATTRWSMCHELAPVAIGSGELQRFESLETSLSMTDLAKSAAGRITVALKEEDGNFPAGAIVGVWPFTIKLEREGREFPNEWDSFDERGWPPQALWNLNITDWYGPASDSVTLVLNSDVELFAQSFPIEEATSAEQRLLLGEVAYDVLATLLQEYLADDELPAESDPSGNQLVDRVDRSFRRLFRSQEEREELKTLAKDNPGRFRMYVQQAAQKSILSGLGG